jgi:hypothetical protein
MTMGPSNALNFIGVGCDASARRPFGASIDEGHTSLHACDDISRL